MAGSAWAPVRRERPVEIGRDSRLGAFFFVERRLEIAVKILAHEGVKPVFRVFVMAPTKEVKPYMK
jgi:hypothetical protein